MQIYKNKPGHTDHAIAPLLLMWWERACFRSKLREDIRDRSDFLRDVGINVLEAHAEACRFFWQPITLKRLPILDYAPATAAIARSAVEAVGSGYCADNALNHQSTVVVKSSSHPSAVLPPLAPFHVEKERRSFFAFITSALHSSRRLQAGRILRQYEHLIAPSEQSAPRQSSQDSETRKMLVTSRPRCGLAAGGRFLG